MDKELQQLDKELQQELANVLNTYHGDLEALWRVQSSEQGRQRTREKQAKVRDLLRKSNPDFWVAP